MVSDFTLMSLKKNCLWTNHEKHVFCPKFPLTCLKMLLVGQNVPKLVRHHACYITVLQMSPNIWEIYTFIDITPTLKKLWHRRSILKSGKFLLWGSLQHCYVQ